MISKKLNIGYLFLLLVMFTGFSVFAQPVADFSSNVNKACSGTAIQFTDLSTGNPTSWLWDFGNGETSTQQNPLAVFGDAGVFTVKLVVSNGNGIDSVIKLNTISIDSIPQTGFIISKNTGCTPLRVFFEDTSHAGGPIIKWLWDFGDGNTDINPITSHTYTNEGIYSPQLITENANGCRDTLQLSSFIQTAAKPVASFYAVPLSACATDPFNFFNTTTGAATSYLWSFGDGDTSTRRNPNHFYQASNYMTVTLVANNKVCADTSTIVDYVYVKPPFVKMRTILDCNSPYTRSFEAKIIDAISFKWDFGDGFTSTDTFPVHTFTSPGSYLVKLLAAGAECAYRDTATIHIIDEKPDFSVSFPNAIVCRNDTVIFDATGLQAGNIQSYTWSYGDGIIEKINAGSQAKHVYSKNGSFFPTLITKDLNGCNDTAITTIQIEVYGPSASFKNDSLICLTKLATFSDQSVNDGIHPIIAWQWDYGDGLVETYDAPPFQHNYTSPALYTVALKVTDNIGCADTVSSTQAIIVSERPVANFSISDTIACFGQAVQFNNTSSATIPIISYTWNFGDNTTASTQNANYIYKNTGTFQVALELINQNGCVDSLIKQVTVIASPNVDAGVDSFLCAGQSIVLNGNGANLYNWVPDNSLSCTACASPVATPLISSKYFLTGIDTTSGCPYNDSVFVLVKQPFNVSVNKSIDTVCIGNTIQLAASGAELYNWSPPEGLNAVNIANPLASPVNTSLYTVTGRDDKNCFTDSKTIQVIAAPLPVFDIIDNNVTFPAGTSFVIRTSNSPDVVSWKWSPATDLSCIDCAQPTTKANKSIQYTGIASTAFGCSASDKINVIGICKDELVFVPNTFSPNGDNINDKFYPRGAGFYQIKSMRIFNRSGQLVFEKLHFAANNAAEGWDGTYRSKKLGADVFLFFIEIICNDGKMYTLKGDITLL
ncbi:PKD domain-containing protein [Limnovirga soli]|uniref:PKD domain-containing protein n=1 Tax=Limnovirga soli TaxID=2656915 RepID=A0A8J8FEM8_9BACT|nr:PKD domain-containing protein [Limnovirga soli]NNV55192.1 PKD domain-containing protein [Limnovirga soli]